MKNECLNCGSKLQGRIDKKFCDSYCRNSFNNKKIRENERIIHQLNSILRKNRTILKKFNPEGKTTIRTEFLRKSGFDFNYFTNLYTTKNNNQYRFCYDYGYFEIDDVKTLIVNWQPYMKTNLTS